MQRPQYVDSNTGQVYDTSQPNFEGWLTKQSVWLKDWRRRYFILKGSKLFFAKNESTAPHGMIDLSACMTVKSAELKAGKRNAIEVSTADTTFYMFADTEKEKKMNGRSTKHRLATSRSVTIFSGQDEESGGID